MADKIEVDLGKACEIIRPSLDNVWWEVSPSDAAKLQTFAGENQSLIVVPQGTGTFHILAIHGKSRDWYQVMVVGPENPQPLPAPSRVAEIARRAWKALPSISAFKPLGILVMFLALSYGVNHYGPLVLDRLKPRPTPVVPVDPPSPFPSPGLRALIVYEATNGAPQLTPAQTDEIYGEALSSYVASKFAKGTDGKTPEFRVWDKDVDPAKMPQLWKDAFLRPGPVPRLIVGNGAKGYDGKLPEGGKILETIQSIGGK